MEWTVSAGAVGETLHVTRQGGRASKLVGEGVSIRKTQGPQGHSVLEEEVPVDGDLGAAFRAPAEAERALARFATAGFGLAPVNVPHAERHGARGLDHDFVLVRAPEGAVPAREELLLAIRGAPSVGDVYLREAVRGVVGRGDDGGPSGLCQADVAQDAVGESRREGDLLARGRSVDAALEIRWQPDRDVRVRGGVHLELELRGPRGVESPTLQERTGIIGSASVVAGWQ